jgi:hypothetical protein
MTRRRSRRFSRLFQDQRLAVLGTREGDGQPYASLMAFAASAIGSDDVARSPRDPAYVPRVAEEPEAAGDCVVRARQLIGQPAGPGKGRGPARVIRKLADLVDFV